jgi:hypothetical protein
MNLTSKEVVLAGDTSVLAYTVNLLFINNDRIAVLKNKVMREKMINITKGDKRIALAFDMDYSSSTISKNGPLYHIIGLSTTIFIKANR